MIDKISLHYPDAIRLVSLDPEELSDIEGELITHTDLSLNPKEKKFTLKLNCKAIVLRGTYTMQNNKIQLKVTGVTFYPPRLLAGHNGLVLKSPEQLWTALTVFLVIMNKLVQSTFRDKSLPAIGSGSTAYFTYVETTHQTSNTNKQLLSTLRNMRYPRAHKGVEEFDCSTKYSSKVQTVTQNSVEGSVSGYDKVAQLSEVKGWIVRPEDEGITRVETKLRKSRIVRAFDQGKGNHVYELGDRVQTFSLQDAYAASRGILKKCRGVFNDLRPLSKLCKHSQTIVDTITSSPGHLAIGDAVSAYFESTQRGEETIRKVRDRVEDYIALTSGVSFHKTFPPSMPTPVSIQPYKCKPFVKENEVGRRVVISYDPRIAKAYSKTTFLNINKTPIHTRPPINFSQPAKVK